MRIQIIHIIDIIVMMLFFISGFVPLAQLIPVPYEMATNMPSGLLCQLYVANRHGWGCARFGSIITNPMPSLVALIVSALCIAWISRSGPRRQIFIILIVMYFGMFLGLTGIIRLIYFLQGHTRISFAAISLFFIGVAGGFVALLKYIPLYLRPVFSNITATDRARQEKLERSIEVEIAERLAEKEKRHTP